MFRAMAPVAEIMDQDPLAPLDFKRLVVVSNREPVKVRRDADGVIEVVPSPGGLVAALDPVMRRSGRGLWVAWQEGKLRPPSHQLPYDLVTVRLTPEEVQHYYHGFANRALWPLAHGFIARCHFRSEDFAAYASVNRKFARAVVTRYQEGDAIWIHDYHLTLAALAIRESLPAAQLRLFWHIPFPPEEIFRALPWRDEVLRGMLANDLVAFHTARYVKNFGDVTVDLGIARRTDDPAVLRVGARRVQLVVAPVAIDAPRIAEIAARPSVAREREKIRSWAGRGDRKLILGVDRLDYTKGILERLRGLHRLFERHPSFRRRVSLVQIAVPSRARIPEYREMRLEIEREIGRINGELTDVGWQPIRYLYRALPFETLVAYYRAADLALITPLADGLNLIAMEYCAAQIDNRGRLVVSEFAGAAEFLREAHRINPWDVDGMADTLAYALDEPDAMAASRMKALRERVSERTPQMWALEALGIAAPTISAMASDDGAA
jgi:trehalose 6-phosphate synthase/phosphatase